ncbi:MAG: hypothetical protein D6691_12255 [Candidatus Hydrogenedentota bacterium]|jgi:PBP1b-binding outer membrane lipoprotein LpoB|uniref:Uncharacterized protein n=1 Tax=Sumerlaea chitinivorans TaxID=2250252 RepID=A0A2Z4Y805_SUMC1|nr:hypothetical protein BRCON_2629 [Candidatus Sumerlaea chitinivorans]RMH24078.1 MAG: hypothetical protein D6691_12255 [Candidatus Hydrogenedentota bacterium]GIX43749.1 MAG: hypothetical protein KatS3mg130_0157 [Candidatus Sumerlaea sp.]
MKRSLCVVVASLALAMVFSGCQKESTSMPTPKTSATEEQKATATPASGDNMTIAEETTTATR